MDDVVHTLRYPTLFITSPRSVAVLGVSSEGLTTTVLPHANAGPTFHVIRSNGRFHGQTTAMTPRGAHRVAARRLAIGRCHLNDSVAAFLIVSAKILKLGTRGMSRA
jgi:hypothetical protein